MWYDCPAFWNLFIWERRDWKFARSVSLQQLWTDLFFILFFCLHTKKKREAGLILHSKMCFFQELRVTDWWQSKKMEKKKNPWAGSDSHACLQGVIFQIETQLSEYDGNKRAVRTYSLLAKHQNWENAQIIFFTTTPYKIGRHRLYHPSPLLLLPPLMMTDNGSHCLWCRCWSPLPSSLSLPLLLTFPQSPS